jgi:hypothetical protein
MVGVAIVPVMMYSAMVTVLAVQPDLYAMAFRVEVVFIATVVV